MNKLVFCSIVFVASLPVYGQTKKIDSLKLELFREKGSGRFTDLYDLVFEYLDKDDYREAFKYIDEAQKVAAQFGDSLRFVKAGRVKGQVLRRLDRTGDAVVEFKKVLPISKRNNFVKEYEDLLNGLAVAYIFQANHDKALQVFFDRLVLLEKQGNHQEICQTLNNIGVVYYNLGNFEKALHYYKRTLDLLDQSLSKDWLLINIGLCYNEMKDFLSARKYIEAGMNVCAPNCSDFILTQGEFALGITLMGLDQQTEAANHFQLSYELAQRKGDKRFQIENLICLARIKNMLGHKEASLEFLTKAESIVLGTGYNELQITIYKQFSELYLQTKRFKYAARYQEKYISLKDSIYSGDLTKNLMRIQSEYEERENNAKIVSQEQILKLNGEVIERQRFLNFLMGTLVALLVLLTLIFFKLSRQRRSMNVLLDRKVEERTLALEQSLSDLRRSHDDQEILLHNISSDMRASVATIRGLCALSYGLEDKPGAIILNVKEFEETAGRIDEIVDRVQRIAKR